MPPSASTAEPPWSVKFREVVSYAPNKISDQLVADLLSASPTRLSFAEENGRCRSIQVWISRRALMEGKAHSLDTCMTSQPFR